MLRVLNLDQIDVTETILQFLLGSSIVISVVSVLSSSQMPLIDCVFDADWELQLAV